MGSIMNQIFNILAGIVNVYMILIFIRIILTWFPGMHFGKLFVFLSSICDPYLSLFRRFKFPKNSPIDFTPIIGIALLSLIHRVLLSWGHMGRISLAAVLAMILSAIGSIFSWVLGFFIIILILRLFGYLLNCNIYSAFWRLVDYIAQPTMYRICAIFFPNRIVGYLFRIIFSIVVLLLISILIRLIVRFGSMLILQLPI